MAPSPARDRFRARLAARPLLADGGMGTLLFSRGVPQRACLEELAATRPDLVGAAHREYIDAGAELVTTLTLGANRHRLAAFGLDREVGRLNRRGAQVAREAREVAGRDVLVGGSVGPIGVPTRELQTLDERTGRAIFLEQIEGLLEGGVDMLVLETHGALLPLLWAADEARRACDLPVLASLTFGEDLVLSDGTTPAEAARRLAAAGVDALGVNCGAGPIACLDALEEMGPVGAGDPPRSVMPNAGLSRRLEGRFVYAAEADYFALVVPEMLRAGAAIVGGCCGTTPEHTAAMRAALHAIVAAGETHADTPDDARSASRQPGGTWAGETRTGARTGGRSVVPLGASPGNLRMPDERRDGSGEAPTPTRLAQALAAGRFVISVEIDPPRSIRIDRTLEAARLLRDAGVDCVNVSDSAMARVRMGAMAVAFGIQRELGLECIVHLTTRDRNLMALESELLGAHALGVRNVLALTGDPPRVGDYPTGTGVWDVDSVGLVSILARLNRGEDQAGSPIGQPAGFTIACALDPTAADTEKEWGRLERKLEAGAHAILTQPLYAADQVEAMLAEARRRFGPRGFPVPVILGVLPLASSRHAEFLHNEVPGITVPRVTRDAMRAAGDRGSEVGAEMAEALLAAVEGEVAGTYLMPSFGRYEQSAQVVRRIRARHPAEVRA